MPLDVDRTEFEPGVVPGVPKFTYFISADVAALKAQQNHEEDQACERHGPDRRRGMATPRSKNSTRGDRERQAGVPSATINGIPSSTTTGSCVRVARSAAPGGRVRQKYSRRRPSASHQAAVIVLTLEAEPTPKLIKNLTRRLEIIRCYILQNFAGLNKASVAT